ncbi:MAG: hypothetical protein OJF49_002091 [Ktedonobacterales bacterium]|jgi:type II secretory pathway pseudopilin PulG|nr:MAG: hypothetical protein OJF49_002091 [Ktedonobacterales bacterium]
MPNVKKNSATQPRRRLPLTARLSLLVLFAAILPLTAVVGINDYFARGTLTQQGINALTTDGKAKTALITSYLRERVLDGEALASLPTAQGYLACTIIPQPPAAFACPTNLQLYKDSSSRALNVGIVRDTNYTVWSIFDARSDLLLTSNPTLDKPGTILPAEDVAPLKNGETSISPVYYDPTSHHAFVRIYTPIMLQNGSNKSLLGFLRATLRLDYIYSIVNDEASANGSGSYAFITDENGVRIASSHPDELFTTIRPLDASVQQTISSEQRYGSNGAVPIDSLPGVASALSASTPSGSFQSPAMAGSSTPYQYVRERITISNPATNKPLNVQWTYFVLSPLSTVTQVADDQLKTSLLSAGVIAILAILIGLLIGRRTAHPVQESTGDLESAAYNLQQLAFRQQSSASEQQWVVDACKTGLDGVRYLSDAMHQASRRIMDASHWFNEYWDRLTDDQAKRTVHYLLDLSRYIDEAARRQQASSDRLDKAITVTMQVSDQLVAGATAAAESADQLERVVGNLQQVVGGKRQGIENAAAPVSEMDMMGMSQVHQMNQNGQSAQMAAAPDPRLAGVAAGNARANRLQMPMPDAPQSNRTAGPYDGRFAPRAPQAPWNAGRPSQTFDDDPGYGQGYDRGYGQSQGRPGSSRGPRSQQFPGGRSWNG